MARKSNFGKGRVAREDVSILLCSAGARPHAYLQIKTPSQVALRIRRSLPRGDGSGRITPHRCHVNITRARRAAPWHPVGPACPTFREPAVDRREKIAGFGALALIAPELTEAGRDAQLKKPGTLLPSYSERPRRCSGMLPC